MEHFVDLFSPSLCKRQLTPAKTALERVEGLNSRQNQRETKILSLHISSNRWVYRDVQAAMRKSQNSQER